MMQRSTLVLSAILGIVLLSFSSCVREYNCQCRMTYDGAPGFPEETIREYPINDLAKNAKTSCESNSAVYTKDGITTTEECKLF
jgi:hypothetical protein